MKPTKPKHGNPSGLFVVPPGGVEESEVRLDTGNPESHSPEGNPQSDRMERLLAELTAKFKPQGAAEAVVIQDMAGAKWRTEYVSELRAQFIAKAGEGRDPKLTLALDLYRVTNEKSFQTAQKVLLALQKLRARPERPDAFTPPKTTGEY